MKRSTLKLVIHREIVRVLAELELVHVAGGDAANLQMDTEGGNNNGCVRAAVVTQQAKP